MRRVLQEMLVGAVLGFVFLGVGGRVVMWLVAMAGETPARFTVGGTLTIIGAGVLAGVAGALMHALSRAIANRAGAGRYVLRVALFAALLILVTFRGLSGSPPNQAVWFWPLILFYGVSFLAAVEWRARRVRAPGAVTGRVVLFEFPMADAVSTTPALTIRGARDAIERFIPAGEFGPLFGGMAVWRPPEEPTTDLPGEAIGVWGKRTCARFRRILAERGATLDVRKERGPEQSLAQMGTSRDRLNYRDRRRLFGPSRGRG